MNSLEKVIQGLVSCNSVSCQKCPYSEKKECNDRGFFYSQAIEDAIQILKEREPKPITITTNEYGRELYHCPNCNRAFLAPWDIYNDYCYKCGQALNWEGIWK